MSTPTTQLLAELEAEKKTLAKEAVLTTLTLVGLLVGVYLQFTGGSLYTVMGAFLLAYLAGGVPAASGAFRNLLQGKLDIDLLMVLAALAAAGVGEVRDGAILLFLFSLAGTLEGYAMGTTRRAVAALMKLRPDEANVEQADGQVIRVAAEFLKLGQIVIVKAGERIPVDGEIIRGTSSVDQAPITGESLPVDKQVGDQVFAGSVNSYGVLAVKMTALAEQSTLARMITLVTEAEAKRSPSERFSEWFGSRYTVVVLVGSIAALGVFIFIGVPYAEAFYKAATLLVVASPCAIVISVPAAVLSALAAAAKRGMLFKGGAAIEDFGNVRIVAFDKTGTLTEGKMSVSKVIPFDVSEEELLVAAASLESESEHPLALSIVEYAAACSIFPREITGTQTLPGRGITATLFGVQYWAGNMRLVSELQIGISREVRTVVSEFERTGTAFILVGTKSTVLGCIALADSIRPTAIETIATLRSAGIQRIVMLTGDTKAVAETIGAQLGLLPTDIYADLLPEDKVAIVNQLRGEGVVAFVGDGVNDAAALATAHVGIAMGGGGSDVALEAADVALISADLRNLIPAYRLAKRANRIIKQNLIFALGILLIMVVITVFFYLPLPLGVIGHEGGTLLVVANGLRLLFMK